jgi:hypothetical protein
MQHPSFVTDVVWTRQENLSELTVRLKYNPETSGTLTDEDRAELRVEGDDGTVLVDAVSEAPYSALGAYCKTVYLDLDGVERPMTVP